MIPAVMAPRHLLRLRLTAAPHAHSHIHEVHAFIQARRGQQRRELPAGLRDVRDRSTTVETAPRRYSCCVKLPTAVRCEMSNTFAVLSSLQLRLIRRPRRYEKNSAGFTALPNTWLIPAVCVRNSYTGSLRASFHSCASPPRHTPTLITPSSAPDTSTLRSAFQSMLLISPYASRPRPTRTSWPESSWMGDWPCSRTLMMRFRWSTSVTSLLLRQHAFSRITTPHRHWPRPRLGLSCSSPRWLFSHSFTTPASASSCHALPLFA